MEPSDKEKDPEGVSEVVSSAVKEFSTVPSTITIDIIADGKIIARVDSQSKTSHSHPCRCEDPYVRHLLGHSI